MKSADEIRICKQRMNRLVAPPLHPFHPSRPPLPRLLPASRLLTLFMLTALRAPPASSSLTHPPPPSFPRARARTRHHYRLQLHLEVDRVEWGAAGARRRTRRGWVAERTDGARHVAEERGVEAVLDLLEFAGGCLAAVTPHPPPTAPPPAAG
jgi:hypothetical protein